MLMGLGALLGLQFRFDGYLISFLVNLLFVGALYGFVWSVILAVRHRHAFSRKIEKSLSKKAFKRLRFAGIIVVLAAIAASLRLHDFWQRLVLVVVGLFFYLLLYLWVFVKAVEESCMLKWVDPRKLTEGDWIAKEVRVRGKYICGPKDLGITKKQIMETIRLARKNKIKRVLIKEGIPFVPSFLITLVLTIGYGNMILLLVAR
jgi:prepilin signal peptidase PulO-like enzyme (type II secretory pathway)